MSPGTSAALPRGPWIGTLPLAVIVLAALGLVLLSLAATTWGVTGELPLSPLGCLWLALWAALVKAGSRALSPFGFDEPLVAGLVAGALTGRLPEGLVAGLTFQVVWPGLAPMGGSREPVAGIAAIVTTGWLALLPAELDAWRLPFAFGAGLAASTWAIAAEGLLRRRNEKRVDRLLAGPGETWAARALALSGTGVAEAALAGIVAVTVLVGVPALAACVLARGGGGWPWVASGAAPSTIAPWLMPLPRWGLSPLLWFALGGVVRAAVRPWTAPAGGATMAEGEAARGRVPAARCPGPGRLWSLLSIQAGFSDRHMQRPAFLALIGGGGGDAAGPRAALREAIATGPPPNTHPVMAAAVVGALDRAVYEAAAGEAPRPVARLLELGATQLAHWGDRVIWGALRPAWALAALMAAPLAGPVAALAFAGGALLASVAARPVLYRWGWRAGWDLVRGGRGRLWRSAPVWLQRAHLPLAAGVVAVTTGLWLSGEPSASASGLRGIWFILGLLLGAAVRRPAAWGWLCWIAAAVGAALDLWRLQNGL